MNTPNTAQPRQGIAAHALLAEFTNLGDNCEFALVQRRAGVEQLGLLRFTFSPIKPLMESLIDRFADLDPVEVLTIEQPWTDEYISCFGTRGFFRHTFKYGGSIDPAVLRKQEVAQINFLRRRLMEDLEAGERIFVRTSKTPAPAEMKALHDVLQTYNTNSLLWVELADGSHPAGHVEQVAPGLVIGYVDRFAPYGDATAVSFEYWLRLCVESYRLLRGPLPITFHSSVASTVAHASPAGCNNVSLTLTSEIEPVLAGSPVFRHCAALAVDNAVAMSAATVGLQPGQTYTAVIWVWLPSEFRGRLVAPTLTAADSLFAQPGVVLERCCWQQMWVNGLITDANTARIAIWADLQAEDVFFTTLWTFVCGEFPQTYLLADTPPRLG